MASRLKEDEKHEKIIRGLLKLPGNRKCINCNVMGPQYVCITFSTFVCTTCGGIHREFTHRVKSVSMAKFTPQEIASLKAGGNERAKETFFKDWEPQRLSAPDSSNVDKLRNFIKHVYVDRRYTGERSTDGAPRAKTGDKEEPTENRRSDSSQSGSRSPPYHDERRYSDRPSPGHDVRSSPGYDQDNRRNSNYGRSPVRPGIVSDWRREDRFSNGRKSDDRRSSDGESKPEIRSPDSQNDSSISSPTAVRPVRDILGDNVMPLRISEPPRANSSRAAEGAVITQRTASSSSLASSNGNPTELKTETSLIDFDASSEPAAVTELQQSVAGQSDAQSTSTPSDDNWACFDNIQQNNVSQALPSSNPLDSGLSELSVPAPVSGISSGDVAPPPSNGMFAPSSSGDFLYDLMGGPSTTTLPGASVTSPFGSLSSIPSGDMAALPGPAPTMPTNVGTAQWHGTQSPQPPPTVPVNQPAAPPSVSAFSGGLRSQAPQASYLVPQAPQAIPAPATQTVEAKPSERHELPVDLFAATYSTAPYQGHGWQTGQLPGMGFPMQYNTNPMQYNTPTSMQTFPQSVQSSNPFDANAEASPPQAAAFPSMSSLHTALPNMAVPGGSVHAAGFGGARPSWMAPHASPYPSAVPPHGSSFGQAMPGAYMGQQLPTNMPPSRPQGFGSFGSDGSPYGSSNTAAAPPNPSLGGNPFG